MSLSPGRLFYLLVHRPRTAWLDHRDRLAAGRGEPAMRAAALALPPAALPDWGLAAPPVRFLTGARFVHQTIFCARSFEWACGTHVRCEIVSDGTLGPVETAQLSRALRSVTVCPDAALAARLDSLLPAARFPHLRAMRDGHVFLRKLIDSRLGRSGPALYLDSDMLFFREPTVLRDWLCDPSREYFLPQSADGLVAPRADLERRLVAPVRAGVNAGLLALDDSAFDWPALESAAAALTPAERAHPWAEQTLTAVHLGRRSAAPLPAADYVLCHSRADLGSALPALRHYAHKSKWPYVAAEWRRWLALSSHPPATSA